MPIFAPQAFRIAGLMLAVGLSGPRAASGMGQRAAEAASRAEAVDPRAWTELDIVPMPKEIRLTDRDLNVAPETVVLVIGAEAGRQSRIGAEWINQRLAATGGGAPLPIVAGTDLPVGKTAILIGTVNDNPLVAQALRAGLVNVGENNPGERGYEIRRSGDGRRIVLAGADPFGALYACVTFGELLEARNDGVYWRAAEVRDAPDLVWLVGGSPVGGNHLPELFNLFRRVRSHDNPPPDLVADYSRVIREHYDRLLRRKFTLIKYASYRLLGQPFEPVQGTEVIREGIDYGRERGIEALLYAEQPFAGRRDRYPEIAASRTCPTTSGPHAYDRTWLRCWSLDELYEETAENLARFIEATGITQVGFHDTDTGWYTSPAQWEERCVVCRERWGDDYAAATINKHRIYYDHLKRRNPDARVHFTFYPYGAPILVPERAADMYAARFGDTPAARDRGRAASETYTRFWQRLHAAFPVGDVTFAIREAPEDAVQAFRALTPKRGLFTWFALMSHAWRPLFSEAAVWSGTFVDNPRDIFGVVAYLDGFVPLESWAVREYSWNRNTPGARPWDRGTLEWGGAQASDAAQWRHAEPHGEIYERILPRLARNVFGRQAAPYISRALSQNVDLQQIFNRQRRQFTWLTDYERMQWQADNAARAAEAMEELWLKLEHDPARLGLDDFTLRRVINLRERLRMGMWAARARAQDFLAQELAADQDRAGAEAAAQSGLDACRRAREEAERLLRERPADPLLEAPDMNRWAGLWRSDMADHADFDFIAERLQRTLADIPFLSALGAIPESVLAGLLRRQSVSTHRVQAAPAPDGLDTDPAWQNAMPVETLLLLGSEAHPARAQTRARLLFDDDHLYMAVECWTPGEQEIRDSDLVEVFLSPADEGDYVHFFIAADGTLRQQYNTIETTGGMQRIVADNDWQCPGLDYAVQREAQRWTVFLKVPAASFKGAIGKDGWRINIARICPLNGGETEISSLQTPGAPNLHERAFYPALSWEDSPYPPPAVLFQPSDLQVTTMTLPDAIASVASFELQIEADRVLHGVRLTAEAYDAEGRLQATQELTVPERILYRWTAPGAFVVEYRQVHAQGGIRLRLNSSEGKAEHWLRFGGWEGRPQAGSIFAPGRNETLGLEAPVYLSDRITTADGQQQALLPAGAGTVEFWFAPRNDWIPAGGGAAPAGTHTFVHYGPHRAGHPFHVNNSPLSIQYTLPSGRLYARLLDQRFAGWLAYAQIAPWPAGQWRHVAVVWETEASEENRLRLYVDGRRLSGMPGHQNRERLPDPLEAMLDISAPFPIQIGALNNGRHSMNGVMNDLLVSRHARYHADFTPGADPEPVDQATVLLFSFDGSLAGYGMTAYSQSYGVRATPGTAW